MEETSHKRIIELIKAQDMPKEKREAFELDANDTVALVIKNPEINRDYKKVPENFFNFIRDHTQNWI